MTNPMPLTPQYQTPKAEPLSPQQQQLWAELQLGIEQLDRGEHSPYSITEIGEMAKQKKYTTDVDA